MDIVLFQMYKKNKSLLFTSCPRFGNPGRISLLLPEEKARMRPRRKDTLERLEVCCVPLKMFFPFICPPLSFDLETHVGASVFTSCRIVDDTNSLMVSD